MKLKKIGLGTMSLTASLVLTCNSFGAAAGSNGYYGESAISPLGSVVNQEPNDSFSTATDISSLTYMDAVNGFISSSSDVDFYKYKTTSSQSGKMKLVLTNPSDNHNYGVMIYKGSSADMCGKIETSGNKTILFSVAPNTTYYIKLYSANSKYTATEPYTFTLQHYSASENFYGKLGWAYPLPSEYTTISSYQCLKGDLGYTAAKEHSGIDLPTGWGNNPKIYNTAKGVVRSSGFSNALGNYVFVSPLLYEPNSVNSSGRFVVRYLHMNSRPSVIPDQTVSRGAVLGNVGSTGATSTGNHLHIDINNIDEGGGSAMRSYPANVINPMLFYPSVNFKPMTATAQTNAVRASDECLYDNWFYSIETVISNEVDQNEYDRFIEMYSGTPDLNIVNFVNHFNYPKELFASIVERYNLDWYDADVIYSNDETLIAEFFGLN